MHVHVITAPIVTLYSWYSTSMYTAIVNKKREVYTHVGVIIFNIHFSQTNVLIGRFVPREFLLHDNNARPCCNTVHELFIARQRWPNVKTFKSRLEGGL